MQSPIRKGRQNAQSEVDQSTGDQLELPADREEFALARVGTPAFDAVPQLYVFCR